MRSEEWHSRTEKKANAKRFCDSRPGSQKVGDGAPDVPFRGSSKVWIFYKVEWVNETGELPRFVRLSRFA